MTVAESSGFLIEAIAPFFRASRNPGSRPFYSEERGYLKREKPRRARTAFLFSEISWLKFSEGQAVDIDEKRFKLID